MRQGDAESLAQQPRATASLGYSRVGAIQSADDSVRELKA